MMNFCCKQPNEILSFCGLMHEHCVFLQVNYYTCNFFTPQTGRGWIMLAWFYSDVQVCFMPVWNTGETDFWINKVNNFTRYWTLNFKICLCTGYTETKQFPYWGVIGLHQSFYAVPTPVHVKIALVYFHSSFALFSCNNTRLLGYYFTKHQVFVSNFRCVRLCVYMHLCQLVVKAEYMVYMVAM